MPRFDTLRRFGRRSTGDAAVARSLDRWLDGDPVAEAASNSDRTELAALQRSATALFELATVAEGATTRTEVELRRDGWSRLMASAPTTKLTPLPASSVGRGRTRAGAWTTAIAIVAVVVLLGAALRGVVEPGNGGEGDQAPSILTAASPTAPSGAVDDEIAGRGGADRAWNFSGSLSPNLGQPVSLEVAGYEFAQDFRTITNAQIFGDFLVVQEIGDQLADPRLIAVDLRARAVAWTQDINSAGGFASDGEKLVLWQQGPPAYGLLALDLATGETLWRYADPTSTPGEFAGNGPILYDGMVYMHDGPLTMYAVNAKDGSPVWSVERASNIVALGWMTDAQRARSMAIVQFAVDKNHVYMLREFQTLEAFDRHTGESAWITTVTVADHPDTYLFASLATGDNSVYVAVRSMRVGAEGQSQSFGQSLMALNAADGKHKWSTTPLDTVGGMVVVGETLFVPALDGLMSLNVRSGERGDFVDRDLSRSTVELQAADELLVLTERVGVEDAITLYDRNLHMLPWSWRLTVNHSVIGGLPAVLIWEGNLIVASVSDGLLIATPIGEATPAASPVTGWSGVV